MLARARSERVEGSVRCLAIAGLAGWLLIVSGRVAAEEVVDRLLAQVAEADRKGDYESAIRLSDELVKRTPPEAEAFYWRGRALFCTGRISDAVRDFDQFVTSRPDREPQQWERGIACYYAGQFAKGARQFELYQTYHDNDVENSVWRFLCSAPDVGIAKARETMLPIRNDPRVPMMEIYDLFRGRATVDDVLAAVRRGEPSAAEREYRLFYARLYVGLYYEAHGQLEQARPYLLDAADQHRTTPGINRFMWSVADVHARRLRAEKK